MPQNHPFSPPRYHHVCHGQKSRFFGDGKIPPLIGNPYNGYINPYYWVDDHPLLYGNNGSLDPGTCERGQFLRTVAFCVRLKSRFLCAIG